MIDIAAPRLAAVIEGERWSNFHGRGAIRHRPDGPRLGIELQLSAS